MSDFLTGFATGLIIGLIVAVFVSRLVIAEYLKDEAERRGRYP